MGHKGEGCLCVDCMLIKGGKIVAHATPQYKHHMESVKVDQNQGRKFSP